MKRAATGLAATLAGLSVVSLAGCGRQHDEMGPSGRGMSSGPSGLPALVSIGPPGGATGVPATTSITFRFATPMGPGMEDLVDLHRGDLAGPVVPMTCGWSADRLTLRCTPASPLEPGTIHTVHMGGGMTDADGRHLDLDQHGPGAGGSWVTGGMLGGHHAGEPWHHVASGWRHSNGSYGMAFGFTTA